MSDKHDFTNEEPAEVMDSADEYLLYALKMDAYKKLNNEYMETKDGKIVAISGNRTEIMEQALKAGANPNILNEHGFSPLMLAANAKETEMLIDAGAKVDFKNKQKDIKGGHIITGQTALMLAREAKQTELLLKAGADVNEFDENGNTALVYAVMNNNGEQFKMLVSAGASLDNLKHLYKIVSDFQVDNKDILAALDEEKTKQETELSLMYEKARKTSFLANKRNKLAQKLGLENVKLPQPVEKAEKKVSKIICNIYDKVRE